MKQYKYYSISEISNSKKTDQHEYIKLKTYLDIHEVSALEDFVWPNFAKKDCKMICKQIKPTKYACSLFGYFDSEIDLLKVLTKFPEYFYEIKKGSAGKISGTLEETINEILIKNVIE